MSPNLCWCPVSDGTLLPDDLKGALCDTAQYSFPAYVGKEHIDYFRGLAHAGVNGAANVIAAIELHGYICLTLES